MLFIRIPLINSHISALGPNFLMIKLQNKNNILDFWEFLTELDKSNPNIQNAIVMIGLLKKLKAFNSWCFVKQSFQWAVKV